MTRVSRSTKDTAPTTQPDNHLFYGDNTFFVFHMLHHVGAPPLCSRGGGAPGLLVGEASGDPVYPSCGRLIGA